VHSGSWISYQVNVVFKNRPPKRVMQRLAVVSREGIGDEAGAWIELKTVENGRVRVERGFFAPPEHATPPGTRAGGAKLGLARRPEPRRSRGARVLRRAGVFLPRRHHPARNGE